MQLVGTSSVKEIDTESNSTIDLDDDVDNMTNKQLTIWLFHRMLELRPVTITGKVPTMDDGRAVWLPSLPRPKTQNGERVLPMPTQSLQGDIYSDFTRLTSIYHDHYHLSIISHRITTKRLVALFSSLPSVTLRFSASCAGFAKKCNVDIFSSCNKIKSKTQTRQAATLLSMFCVDCFFLVS